jgi:hypothetical protein
MRIINVEKRSTKARQAEHPYDDKAPRRRLRNNHVILQPK